MRKIGIGTIAMLFIAAVAVPAGATVITTFDSSGGYAGFSDLASAYRTFMGTSQRNITFSDMPLGANPVGNFYSASHGVTFSNEGSVVMLPEGNQVVAGWYQGNLAGYDGSYMPDGATAYNKIYDDNPDSPLTITFAAAVSSVGGYVANSAGGPSAMTIRLYDAADNLLSTITTQVNPWGDCDNIEGFWGAKSDQAQISKVTILSTGSYGVATLGNLEFSSASAVPEPITMATIGLGGLGILLRRNRKR